MQTGGLVSAAIDPPETGHEFLPAASQEAQHNRDIYTIGLMCSST
jgi:hypothetical protein